MQRLVMIIIVAGLLAGTGCRNDVSDLSGYDYVLRQEADVIHPPSGTPDAWITIIGGDYSGDYYVAPDGDDGNPGTAERPFRTIALAVSRLQPGDTLVVRAGAGRLRPVIAGENNLYCAFDLSGCQYLRIENLEITSTGEHRFREGFSGTAAPVAHLELRNLKIHHLDEFGIDIGDALDLQIVNCSITYCGFGSIGGPAGQAGGWREILIDGCDLSYSGHYYQGGDGSRRPYDRPDGFGIEASAGPIEICRTTATHNCGDGLDSKAERTCIHECLVANNACDGIKLWGDSSRIENCLIYGRGDGNTTITPWSPLVISTERRDASFEIINCTVDDSLGGNYLLHVQYDQPDLPVRLKIVNTVFSSRGTNAPAVWLAPAVSSDLHHNLFFSPQEERILIQGERTFTRNEVSQLGTGNLYADPQFVRPAWGTEGNYHLSAGSPALDAGDPASAPAVDLDGRSRPQGAGVDIGCYEGE